MKPTFIVLAVLSYGLCWGQASDDCKANALNIPEAKYPCVYPDGRAILRPADRWRHGGGPIDHDLLWIGMAKQRYRNPRAGRRVLPAEGCAARPRERAVVLLQGDCEVAAVLRLRAAGL